jgi:ferrous iron transport protein B
LALEIQQYNIPVVFTLNLLDVAERHGIIINAKFLEQELSAPVIPTVAVKKIGFNELKFHLKCILEQTDERPFTSCGSCASCPKSTGRIEEDDIWAVAKLITDRAVKKDASKLSSIDRLGDNMMKPFPGIAIAFLVLAVLMGVVVGGGEILREMLLLPLVNNTIVPFFRMIFESFMPEGAFRNILIGEFGIFVISFQWIIALILPYVFLFYVAFSFLEDSGYLPRLGVLFDSIMRKLGVQGGSFVYTIMGIGCAVPAIIGTRAATTYKERMIISTAICFAVPCVSQIAALAGLLSAYEWWMMPAVFLFALMLFAVTALLTGKIVKGKVDPLIIEVPNLLVPEPKAYGRKLLTRMKHFLKDAEIPMMAAVVLAAVLQESGALAVIARYAEPLVSRWLGMPPEAVTGMILGIIRREMMVAPLVGVTLTSLQAFVWGVVALMYIPCISVFAILVKEFKLRTAVTIFALTIISALLIGGIINQIGSLFY